MKQCFTFLLVLLLSDQLFAQPAYEFAPQNPINAAWLLLHLNPRHPRLLLPADLAKIRPAAQQPGTLTPLHYQYLLQNAEALLSEA